jgi:hypothetical protein
MPNVSIAMDGSDAFVCVLTSLGGTIIKCFPDGTPKLASCDVEFSEIVQDSNTIKWKGREAVINGDAAPWVGYKMSKKQGKNNPRITIFK